MKTIAITGASSGIGKACALYFAKKGWNIGNSGRMPISAEEVAEEAFKAAMDDSDRLRYPVGDAGQLIQMRFEVGEENFIHGVGNKFLS